MSQRTYSAWRCPHCGREIGWNGNNRRRHKAACARQKALATLHCGECLACQEWILAPSSAPACPRRRQMARYLRQIDEADAPEGWGPEGWGTTTRDGRSGVDVTILQFLKKSGLIADNGIGFRLTDAGFVILAGLRGAHV